VFGTRKASVTFFEQRLHVSGEQGFEFSSGGSERKMFVEVLEVSERRNAVRLSSSHIAQRFARAVNDLCCEHLHPYINFHRRHVFAETERAAA
jgi:hypothetical protein